MNYLKQIQCVMTIAQEESISRAADKLGIAQPTLSKYLQKLERELGLALFDRNTIPLKLTQAGEYFVQAGAQMMDIDRQLRKKLDSVRENSNLELRLGIGVSRSMYLLPKILAEYRKSNPENRVLIKEGITAEISGELSDGRLDLAVSLLDEHTVQFDHIKLFDETVLLAVHESFTEAVSSALDQDGRIQLRGVCGVPFISLSEGQYLRNVLKALCEEDVTPAYECQNIESALALVRAGMGITLVPSYIRDYGAGGRDAAVRFYEISCPPQGHVRDMLDRKVCIFCRRKQFLSQAERDLIACCERVCGG